MFLSGPDGRLRPSEALADAVRREHTLRPDPRHSGPADLHLKSATSGDIDGDSDIDLWVDSIGGANVYSHFMVNNGDGTFTVDEARAPTELRWNPPEGWYHLEGHLVDLDNDTDLDLALGQSREILPSTVNQFSIVLVNDGTGHYPSRIELPRPAFNEGFTAVTGQTHFDVNGDGFQDLMMVHVRNDNALPNVLPFTGRYVQLLVNRDGTSFGDETAVRLGDQSATTPERDPNGDPLSIAAAAAIHDLVLPPINTTTYCRAIMLPRRPAGMPRKSPYTIELADDEAAELHRRARKYTLPYFQVLRAQMILLAADGRRNDEIAEQLNCRREVVAKWRKRFFERRLAGLDDRDRPGRPRVFPP